MAVSSCQLPIIDFSKDGMKPGTKTWDLTCEHVQKALEEYGCFEAKFNEINLELYSAFFGSLEKLFDLPKETKRRCSSDVPFYGYASDSPISPLLESMGLTHPLTFQAIQNLALLMWPQGDPTFCESLNSYMTRVQKLEETVRKVIFQSYGLKNHFEKEYESMKCSVRLMKYGAPMTDKDTLGVGMHYDKNMITLLESDDVGLQVRNKDGEWITPRPSSSSLIVMMGESFHGWSNGRLRCPLHRVRLSGHEPRYSVALFSSKNGKIEIPRELVDEQHPLLFKPFHHASLLQIFKQQLRDKTYTKDDQNCVPIVTTHFAL